MCNGSLHIGLNMQSKRTWCKFSGAKLASRLSLLLGHGFMLVIALPAAAGPAYSAWERSIRAECLSPGRGGSDDLSRCSTTMMERAVAEGHLTQAQVDSCRAQEQVRQRGRATEFAAWARCGLRDTVQVSIDSARPQTNAQDRPAGSRPNPAQPVAPVAQPPQDTTARAETPAMPSVAAPGEPSRLKTEGTYVDWHQSTTRNCKTDTSNGRSACAQTLIDRALSEGRLLQTDVSGCGQAEAPAPTGSARSAQIDEIKRQAAARKAMALGDAAVRDWEGVGSSCKLAALVKNTFAAVGPPTVLMPGGPSRDPQDQQVERFDARWFAQVVRVCHGEGQRDRPRDYCARRALDLGVSRNRLSSAALDTCRAAATQGGEPDYLAVYACIERAGLIETARGSTIVTAIPSRLRAGTPPPGLKRPDIIAALQAGDWAHLPLRDVSDGNYYLNAFVELGSACPSAEHELAAMRVAATQVANTRLALDRVAKGGGDQHDMSKLLVFAGKILAAPPDDCDKYLRNPSLYQMCMKEREAFFSPPPSPQAVHDVALLVRQQTCTTPALRSFTANLVTALTLPSHSLGAMNWALGTARAAEYEGIFANCRRQAGDSAADGWCACYVRNYSAVTAGGTRTPAEAVQHVRSSAFFGNNFFDPGDLPRCETARKDISSWRQARASAPQASACLLSQAPLADALQPGTRACRYRTAWGEIELRQTSCPQTLQTNQWGGELVTCQ